MYCVVAIKHKTFFVAIHLNMFTARINNKKNYCISTCTDQSSSAGTPLGESSAFTFEQTINYIMKLMRLPTEDRHKQSCYSSCAFDI